MPLSYSHIATMTSGAWLSMTEIEGPSKGANGQPFEEPADSVAVPDRTAARKVRLSYVVLGAVLGTMAAGVVAVIVVIALLRDDIPLLTQAEFDTAESRWEKNGPTSYDLDVAIIGKRPGKVHIEVRNGEITHMQRDGVEPRQKRTWYYWSVPGQLETIGWELEKSADPVAGFQAPAGSQVIQRAQFDPHYGYPLRYSRDILGADMDVGWETTKFQAVE
jgi:hypothetical protein